MFCTSSPKWYLVTPGEFFLKLMGLVEPWLLLAGVLELSCEIVKSYKFSDLELAGSGMIFSGSG
jgi:hypothetical protein